MKKNRVGIFFLTLVAVSAVAADSAAVGTQYQLVSPDGVKPKQTVQQFQVAVVLPPGAHKPGEAPNPQGEYVWLQVPVSYLTSTVPPQDPPYRPDGLGNRPPPYVPEITSPPLITGGPVRPTQPPPYLPWDTPVNPNKPENTSPPLIPGPVRPPQPPPYLPWSPPVTPSNPLPPYLPVDPNPSTKPPPYLPWSPPVTPSSTLPPYLPVDPTPSTKPPPYLPWDTPVNPNRPENTSPPLIPGPVRPPQPPPYLPWNPPVTPSKPSPPYLPVDPTPSTKPPPYLPWDTPVVPTKPPYLPPVTPQSPPTHILLKKCLKPRGQFQSDKCNKYVNCWDGVAVEQFCPEGLLFSHKGYCDYGYNVDCQGKPIEATPPPPVETTTTARPVQTSSPPTYAPPPTVIVTLPTIDPALRKKCLKPRGQFRSTSCNKYVNCWDDVVIEQECPEGLLFSNKGYCDYPANVNCHDKSVFTRESVILDKECLAEFGTFREKENCSSFVTCIGGKVVAKNSCPEGFNFNDNLGVCDYSDRVDCSKEPLIFLPKSHVLSNVPKDFMKKIDDCKPGSMFALNQQCTAACLCHDGLSEVVQCPSGLAYDSTTDKCVPPQQAKC